jgi:hypothetical protein
MGIGSYLIRLVSPQDHWIWPGRSLTLYRRVLLLFNGCLRGG